MNMGMNQNFGGDIDGDGIPDYIENDPNSQNYYNNQNQPYNPNQNQPFNPN